MDVAVILLTKGNKINIFNKTAEKIFNRSLALAKNNDFSIILSEFKEIIDVIKSNISAKRGSFELDSNNKSFEIELIQMLEIGTLLIIKDITEEKKREIIIQRNRNFIMLGEMAAFLVHEVRNSLGVIFGYTRTINKEVAKIDKVNKEIVFLTEMMERFLDFSKPLKEETSVEVDLKKMVENLAEKCNIKLLLTGEEIALKTDSIKLETVLSNLFRNAVEAEATELKITIETKNNLSVLIRNNGKGIDSSDLERIWFPFFTTKTKGTGMGLALVKKFLHYLNGDICLVESNSEGTEFRIDLY